MSWLQLSLEAGELDPETLSSFFEERGALSVTFVDAADQPLFEPEPGTTPLWSSTRVTALFAAGSDTAGLREQLAGAFGVSAARRLTEETLQDQDWERAWLDQFQPMRFGRRLWVCPAGQRPPESDDWVLIDLDPGLAFGTGTHATTALCLEWLDRHPPLGQQVVDYGCGSGILAIAALKLGARSVWGVDIDEQALWASQANAARNGVAAGLRTSLPDGMPARTVDLVLANILANPLMALAPRLSSLLRAGGDLVLSGVLKEQAHEVRDAYAEWIAFETPVERDGWVCLCGKRR